jgi:Recombination endonuclease VII
MLQRNCPKCSKTIGYGGHSAFSKATKLNSLCKRCTGLNRFTTDFTGQRFGKLTVIRRVLPSPLSHSSAWLVRCDCGSEERIMAGSQLKHRQSCGCWRPNRRTFTEREKRCPKCEKWLPLDSFGVNVSRPSGRTDRCKRCLRNGYYEKEYDFSLEQRVALLEKQGGKCAICKASTRLCLDHDHETGFVRGFLCVPCNVMLGRLNEDVTKLLRAIKYIKPDFETQV